ncbi:hypothetical protein N3K66_007733 [Trichothecium roseum]|uniref:Uncharacterized protein n=1 Tax=Trichothecium roseum TaxID=47278 RepID=A0ACC0UVB3_9HYPO|nr:hypothetical protein N3K66_007733 [Trichothecium roseum]
MIANQPLQHHLHHPHHHDTSSYCSASRPRVSTSTSATKRQRADSAAQGDAPSDAGSDGPDKGDKRRSPRRRDTATSVTEAPARIPSPPASSSPHTASDPAVVDDVNTASMASSVVNAGQALAPTEPPSVPNAQQPSPVSDGASAPVASASISASSPTQPPVQTTVQIRDLGHITTLAETDMLSEVATVNEMAPQTKYDISGMPIGDVIEMVAALLTKITSTNDLQHNAMQRNVAHQQQANQSSDSGGHSQISPMSHSVLAFHGKNVPAITIHSYLARIHKYCPTTFEVFLSLLVYFDRMTERVNDLVTKSEEARRRVRSQAQSASTTRTPDPAPALSEDVAMRDGDGVSDETDSDLADDDDDDDIAPNNGNVITAPEEHPAVNGPSTYFVVDSFNIHRLIIAGVTCSSKFFSDVFYTNSRYAKVGGLPLAELNHLELQFLVLNDFRLSIPVEDLEAYATMLVEFYAREVVSKKSAE